MRWSSDDQRRCRTPTRRTPSAARVSRISESDSGLRHGVNHVFFIANSFSCRRSLTTGNFTGDSTTVAGDPSTPPSLAMPIVTAITGMIDCPEYTRNAYLGPDYFTSDLRLSRQFPVSERMKVELLAEAFNFTNRDNKRVEITDDGFVNAAAKFVPQHDCERETISGVLSWGIEFSRSHQCLCSSTGTVSHPIRVLTD